MKKIENLPTYNIDLDWYLQATEDYIKEYKSAVDDISFSNEVPTWETLDKLDIIGAEYSKKWGAFSHLLGVLDSDNLRKVYDEVLPIMSEFSIWISMNLPFAEKIKQLKDSGTLDAIQQKVIDDTYLGFELSGVYLSENNAKRFASISKRSAVLENTYRKNTLDSTKAWTHHITNIDDLDGVPETSLSLYAMNAKQRGLDGWLLTLDAPSVGPVMAYCHNRPLREMVSKAASTKASRLSDNPEFDNTAIIDEMMQLRFEQANILDRGRPADLSLIKKMANSPEEVIDFLYGVVDKVKPIAEVDEKKFQEYVLSKGCDDLQSWDRSYYGEMMKKEHFDVDTEEVKKYFQLENVLAGLFELVGHIFEIEIREEANDDVWHDDVRFFRLYKQGEHFSSLYMDLYSDPSRKRGGAWMDAPVIRWEHDGVLQLPVAYNVCNFSKPTEDVPSLLSFREVETLFHEFGHGLHQMLTEVSVMSVSGTNGVEWDAVELPSQIMENWCWSKEVIDNISEHYVDKTSMPDDMFNKMVESKNFMSAHGLLRQVEMSIFDMELHMNYDAKNFTIRDVLGSVRDKVSVVPSPDYNRFENTFSHIFSGAYAAGYYSYLWAEVLSADAFSKFKEDGIFNIQTADKFRKEILSQGGTQSMKVLFKNFMGREPNSDALLKDRGITVV
jgi:oligopeptidase A